MVNHTFEYNATDLSPPLLALLTRLQEKLGPAKREYELATERLQQLQRDAEGQDEPQHWLTNSPVDKELKAAHQAEAKARSALHRIEADIKRAMLFHHEAVRLGKKKTFVLDESELVWLYQQ